MLVSDWLIPTERNDGQIESAFPYSHAGDDTAVLNGQECSIPREVAESDELPTRLMPNDWGPD